MCVWVINMIPRDDTGVCERPSKSHPLLRPVPVVNSTAPRPRLRLNAFVLKVLAQTWLGRGAGQRGAPRYLRRAADAGDENACLEVLDSHEAATAGSAQGGVPREHWEQYDWP